MGHSKVLENLDVIFWAISSLWLSWRRVNRAHKCDELVWDDPIEITIFNLLVIFVLFVVEVSKAVPAKPYSKFKSLQTVEHSTLISASVTVACISERSEL